MIKILFGLVITLGLSITAIAEEQQSAVTNNLAESEIPLNMDNGRKIGDSSSANTKAMASVAIILLVAGVSFHYVRRYKTSNSINKSNMQIKILTQHYLGPKKSLAIVHVAGESILVGVTDHNISMIKSLSLIDDEVPASLPNTFGQQLQSSTELNSAPIKAAGSEELDEEFSFTNVTDAVSKKLKSMRSFS